MTHPEILIPFSLPPAEHAKDLTNMLISECGKDGLAMLLSRNLSLTRTTQDDFSPQLPYEKWLSQWLDKYYQTSFLSYCANTLKVNLPPGHWFLLNPVHLHIARNHLVLTDYRQLDLPLNEATLLFEKAKLLCNEVGVELLYGSATQWFLGANQWADFTTSTPDAACGHNIDIWLPKGSDILSWRKLQNEIQMTWFADPIQEQREQRGKKPVNGIWLSHGTAISANTDTNTFNTMTLALGEDNIDKWENFTKKHYPSPHLILLDQLTSAALSNDWGSWAAKLIELEHAWFKPLCAALKKRQHNQSPFSKIAIHLSNTTTLLHIENSSNALYQFWRASNFNNLTP